MGLHYGMPEMADLAPHVRDYAVFGGMIAASLVLRTTPLGRPLGWAETFYHELSHALVCLLTFGRVGTLHLYWRGGGQMTYRGGLRVLVAFAGYAGAAAWGAMLYMVGWVLGNEGAVTWLYVELGILVLAIVLWVRDVQTLLIMVILMGVYGAGLYLPPAWMGVVLQFVGIHVMLNAIQAPLHLIDGRNDVGDGVALQKLTLVVPEFVWILIWFGLALGALGMCAVLTLPGLAPVAAWVGRMIS